MCGISGVVDFNGHVDASAVVRRMTETMLHRGPDDEGYLEVNCGSRIADCGNDVTNATPNRGDTETTNSLASIRVALGMRRLSIIDLAGGHQPIFNEDGSIAVVLNGEIYNFQSLQTELERLGHTFRTASDCEVIVHAYEEWGERCVERLQGMFAFAVFDRGKGSGTKSEPQAREGEKVAEYSGKLFLARDRTGIKPLYYYVSDRSNHESLTFLFASEVRSLLASGLVPKRLSASAVESYLLFGSVSEPMTLIDGVRSLTAGHTLTIQFAPLTSSVSPRPYWNMTAAANQNGHATVSETAAAQRVRELLDESVRLHLIADVPVGVFLSGGIDSTSVAALASHHTHGVHTFTVSFAEQEFSEASIARATAQHFGTTHQEFMLRPADMLARLPEALRALDQPSMDGINTYFVSWAARQTGLKVALSGLGGDELFGGYRGTFHWTRRYKRIASTGALLPAPLRAAVGAALGSAGKGSGRGDAARKLVSLWSDSQALPHPYYFARALFPPAQTRGLLRPSSDNSSPWREYLTRNAEETNLLDDFTAVSCLEARSYMVNTLLRDTDSMSMAHSLEVRVPFLHHPLVDFVTALPESVKVGNGTHKALLVKAVEDLLPAEVVQQRKRGFTFPWQQWLRGPLRVSIEAGLSQICPALAEIIDEAQVRNVWQEYLKGRTSWSRPWSLFVLNEWSKRMLDC